jgi:hypothetical protein
MNKSISLVSLVAILSLASGCLVNTSDREILEPDTQRCAVEFQSDAGLDSFQGNVQARYAKGDAVQERSGSSFPLL